MVTICIKLVNKKGWDKQMKVSVIIPVYNNENSIMPLYEDIKQKFIEKIEFEYEIVMINDGSSDTSYQQMLTLAAQDDCVKAVSLSRNFGSHAAILCGMNQCTGDCAIVKAADLQEPTELLLQMVTKWKEGSNVVLAVRKKRPEKKFSVLFSNLYYWMVRKTSFPNMPKKGFDVYLADRKVVDVLTTLDESNSALTGQLLWSGFRTTCVYYERREREIGKSQWTLKKKVQLVMDTLFSFSVAPVKFVTAVGFISFFGALVWSFITLGYKMSGKINVQGWTMLFIFQLFSFGLIMITLGILGEYLWRIFDASRNRPTYIVEDIGEVQVSARKEVKL